MATSNTATAITPMSAKRVREPQYKRRKGVPRPRRSPHCFNQPPFGHILPMSKRISKEPHRENMSKPVSPKRCGSISLGVMSGRRQILIVHQKCGLSVHCSLSLSFHPRPQDMISTWVAFRALMQRLHLTFLPKHHSIAHLVFRIGEWAKHLLASFCTLQMCTCKLSRVCTTATLTFRMPPKKLANIHGNAQSDWSASKLAHLCASMTAQSRR